MVDSNPFVLMLFICACFKILYWFYLFILYPYILIAEVQKWLHMIYEEEHLYNDRMLAVAAVIVEKMRAAVYEKTGYKCSAGIAHNKVKIFSTSTIFLYVVYT